MVPISKRRMFLMCFILFFVSVPLVSCSEKPRHAINMGPDGIAIKGYDTVAYFTKGKPVKGSEEYAYEWNGAKWLFSNMEHLALFKADPMAYAPQFGGY